VGFAHRRLCDLRASGSRSPAPVQSLLVDVLLPSVNRTQAQATAWGLVAVIWSLGVAGCGSSKPSTAAPTSIRRATTAAATMSGTQPPATSGEASGTRAAIAPTVGTIAIPSACELLTPSVAAQILGVSSATLFQENGGGGGSKPSVCGYLPRGSSQGEPQISLAIRHGDGTKFRFLRAESEKKVRMSHGRDSVMTINTLGQEAYEATAPNGVYLVILNEGVLFLPIGTEAESSHRDLGPVALAAARRFSL
jgi:hypothetical protein